VISRRSLLRGVGVSLALPMLASWGPRDSRPRAASPRRLAILSVPFGMVEEGFHPRAAGFDYELPATLAPLAPLRGEFTVFSRLDHGMKGGHAANHTLLSGIKLAERAAWPEGNVTIDQRAAEVLGTQTRFPSLVFWNSGLSFTRTGLRVPAVGRPSQAFRLLFVEESEREKRFARASLASSGSILDAVRADARRLQAEVDREDRAKLEEYFTSIRETEEKLQLAGAWLDREKPKVDGPEVAGIADGDRDEPYGAAQVELWFDLMYLALITDSTRVVATTVDNCNWGLEGVQQTYHTLSHHRMRDDLLQQLGITEVFLMRQLARFLGRLKETRQADGSTLLDSTQVLFGSGLGNGNRHTNDNLPMILAGGGFRHGQHLDCAGKQPLCSLYLSMLQALGCETERFNCSNGTLHGLEISSATQRSPR
jgi:hypothetical protein